LAAKVGCFALLVLLLSCDSQVGPEDTAYLQIIPASWSPTALGDTTRFVAIAKTAFGKTLPNVTVTWTTEPFGVVTVHEDGVGIAQNTGTAQVRAIYGSALAIANVTVTQTIESVIILTYFGNTLAVGDSMMLYVDARDRNSFSVPGATFSFQSLDPGIATVSLEGWIKGKSAGEVSIVAMAAGKVDTAGFVITP
jgi:hypothetical protein